MVEVSEAVFYVNSANSTPAYPYTSWDTAAVTIQEAIEAGSVAGRLILVTNGVYDTGSAVVDGGLINRLALIHPIIVRSVNGPQVTMIVGSGPQGSNSVRCAYIGIGAILSGFTLTNGHTRTSGGGAWCESSGVLTNCVLTGNSAVSGGGAYCAATIRTFQ
jgi:hypothetical protein